MVHLALLIIPLIGSLFVGPFLMKFIGIDPRDKLHKLEEGPFLPILSSNFVLFVRMIFE